MVRTLRFHGRGALVQTPGGETKIPNVLWRGPPKKYEQQKKIDKLDFIKVKNFCASNDTIKKMKR